MVEHTSGCVQVSLGGKALVCTSGFRPFPLWLYSPALLCDHHKLNRFVPLSFCLDGPILEPANYGLKPRILELNETSLKFWTLITVKSWPIQLCCIFPTDLQSKKFYRKMNVDNGIMWKIKLSIISYTTRCRRISSQYMTRTFFTII